MINFRFHIASLIAVFLALGVGVVMGSTVVQEGIVTNLRNRIDTVEANADDARSENSRLNGEVDRMSAYIEATAPYAVFGELTGQSVAVVAERGLDEDVVEETVALLGTSGASVTGVLWLEPAWSLAPADGGPTTEQLADIVGGDPERPREARSAALRAVAGRVARGAPLPGEEDVLAQLAQAGFVTFAGDGTAAGITAFPGAEARALVLSGSASELGAPRVVATLVQALVDEGVLTTVGDIWTEPDEGGQGADRGDALAAIREDETLSAAVSTVDDIDLIEGRVAAPLAIADLLRGVVGHYGYGAGAQAPVPPFTPR